MKDHTQDIYGSKYPFVPISCCVEACAWNQASHFHGLKVCYSSFVQWCWNALHKICALAIEEIKQVCHLSNCWLNPFCSNTLWDKRPLSLTLKFDLWACACTCKLQRHVAFKHMYMCCRKWCSLVWYVYFPEVSLISWGLILAFQTTELLWLTNLI